MAVRIKRIYEPYSKDDGYRILVDRLWPRGVKKEAAHVNTWLKEVAPSAGLRKWFGHDPAKWTEFKKKYHAELKGSEALDSLLSNIHEHKTVTLLYGAKDEEHNQAAVLQQLVSKHS